MRPHLLLPRVLLGAVLVLGLAVAPAQATTATLSPDGQFLDVTETSPGEVNHVGASLHQANGVQYIELFDDTPVIPGNGCTLNPDTHITRCTDPAQMMRVSLGAGDDKFTPSEVGTAITFGGGVTLDLGPGNDVYFGDSRNASIDVHGGDGDDDLKGGTNVDHLFGGPGNDTLTGNENADDLHGEDGDDTLKGDGPSAFGIFSDTIDGGAGKDVVYDYVYSGDPGRAPAINLTFDGVANDGRQGENDNLIAVEIVDAQSAGSFTGDDGDNEFTSPEVGAAGTLNGMGGNDTLIAGDAHGDVVDGGSGSDLVEGGFGDDRLIGGPGRDIVNGDRKSRCNEYSCDLFVAGSDTIEVRDGEVDSVSCGTGIDRVVADADDVVAADCETVERAAATPPDNNNNPNTKPDDKGKAKARTALAVVPIKLRNALARGLTVRLTNVSGTINLKAKRGKALMAKGSARAKGGKATVRLRFTKAAKRTLRHARKVTLRISGAGTSRVVTLKR
jgi:Ca2+-binding RTX toxin-like protein